VIAHIWRGWTTPDADPYQRIVSEEVLLGITARNLDGHHGASLLRRDLDGEDYEAAYLPRARAVLARFEERSAHNTLLRPPGLISGDSPAWPPFRPGRIVGSPHRDPLGFQPPEQTRDNGSQLGAAVAINPPGLRSMRPSPGTEAGRGRPAAAKLVPLERQPPVADQARDAGVLCAAPHSVPGSHAKPRCSRPIVAAPTGSATTRMEELQCPG
jgi:hypothetical protein